MAASRSVGGACARRRFARAYRQLRPRDGQCESDRAGCDRQPPFLPRTRGRSLFAVASTRIRIRSRRSSDPATTRFPSRNARESSVSARLANAKAIIYCWLSSSSPTGRHNYGPPALGGKRGTFPNVAMQEVERAKARNMAKKQNSKVERQKSSDKTLAKAPSIETKKHEK